MSFQITLNPGARQFVAAADETLLEAGLCQGLVLPHACREGVCAACKSKLLRGTVAYNKPLLPALSAAEQAAGLTLLCCAEARSDLVLESRQALANDDFPAKKMPARVERLEFPTPDVARLFLKLPASERLQFRAGQYLDVVLKDGRRRSFSLANAPSSSGLPELHIRKIEGGAFTGSVFATLKVRDLLRIEGPYGAFGLHQDSSKPAILLAGGTGFAPIKAIIEEALLQGCQRPLRLYWGARSRRDLYLPDLPQQWASAHPDLRYTAVLSQPLADDVWRGRQGLVHAAVLEDFPDLSAVQVYACGAPPMIAAARADFIARGNLPENEFFADAFAYSLA